MIARRFQAIRSRHFFTLVVGAIAAAVFAPMSYGQGAQTREYPPSEYYLAFNIFDDGDFAGAARAFGQAGRLGIRSTEGRWVDSICYHAMIGESLYQMGELGSALDEYTAALNLFLAHRNWLLRVEMAPGLEPDRSRPRRPVNWGVTTRRTVPARFPNRYPILQGRFDNERVLQQGGVVALPEFYLINAHEIMRCTGLAIRRRGEIMGRAAAHDPLTGLLVQALAVRPAPPNHWSGAWISSLLGLTYASAGRVPEAQAELGQSLTAGGNYDHPLTATSLLALGKLAFAHEQYGQASQWFLEASYSAAWFSQYGLVEESLRHGALTHIVSGQNGLYPPLAPAANWARRQADFLEASLVVSAAEVAATAGETAAAITLLEQTRRTMARADMRVGAVGARQQYVLALASYAAGNVQNGDAAFAALMAYQRKNSFRLFELGLIDQLALSGRITERQASQLYEYALREPTAQDWAIQPVETLSVVLTPHLPPLEHWFQIALKRKQNEDAIQITDRIRRHRFFTTLPMGGRLVALRWVLEASDESLSERARLQRQDILARYPKYAALAKQAAALRREVKTLPLVPDDDERSRKQVDLLKQLDLVSKNQEIVLREIALRRVPADFVFPPPLDFKKFKDEMPDRSMVLSFIEAAGTIHVFSFGKEEYLHWQIDKGAKLTKDISDFLRQLGHYDKNQPVELDAIQDDAWKEPARELLAALTNNATPSTWEKIDELIIVPDGPLWYTPFEALQVGKAGETVPLISRTRIRYAPTIALAKQDTRPAKRAAETAVVVGALFPRDSREIAESEFELLRTSLPDATRLPDPLTVPSSLLAAVSDRLVVLTDIQREASGAYEWSPVQMDRGKLGSTLSHWMTLPWGSPDQVILPGFHSSAESAMKRGSKGEEVFLAVCGLMASGSRTVLISRWRTGGKTSYDLVREFVQELPYTTASDAWQRSVFLAMQDDLFLEREPRVKPTDSEVNIKCDHPFFWAGYVLAGSGAKPLADEPDKTDAVADK